MQFKILKTTMLASVCALALFVAACSNDFDEALKKDMASPARVDALAPPMAPDANSMHPALQIARARGDKTNVYFNEELQQAAARLHGMEETLGRLQSDLQGTAMAMQRVEMLRQEVEALNIKIQSIQERAMYAGPSLEKPAMPAEPVPEVSANVPMPAPTVAPEVKKTEEKTAQKAKPVVEEPKPKKAAAPAPAPTGDGVAGIRIGTHADHVRIVLDVNGSKTEFSNSIDSAEKILTIELPETAWSAPKSQKLKGNPLIESYTAQSEGKGSVVAFTLKKDTKILQMQTLKGAPTRLLIDLAK